MTKQLKPKINTTFGGIVDKTSYLQILLYIASTLFGFAIIYFIFDPFKHNNINDRISFLDSIYFSVVTFATLGYGDIIPEGVGKVLAILEVLTGLFLVAIFVGKISSERQSTKLTLIYSSLHHQRILQFITDIAAKQNELKDCYDLHDNKLLFEKSKECYDLISVIRKYLIFQSLEGELAFGNSSTLRRLYISLFPLEQLCAIIIRTYGVSENVITYNKRTVASIGEIGSQMQIFHQNDSKILANLKGLELENSRLENDRDIIYRTSINQELISRVLEIGKKYTDIKNNYKLIAAEIGMTNKLCLKCIENSQNGF